MTDLLSPLRAADPARDNAPTAAEARRMDAIVERALRAEPRPAPTAPRRSRPRRRAPFALAATGLAAAAVAFAAVLAAPEDSSVAPQPASAAIVLGRLSAADAATPDPAGRYAYQRSISYTTHMRGADAPYAVVFPHVREEWLDDDGNGVTRERIDAEHPSFPTPEDRAAYERSGQRGAGPFPGSEGVQVRGREVAGLAPARIRALPTEPTALHAAVVDGMQAAGVKADNAFVAGAAQLLSSPLTPQPVRAALFDALRAEPGATVSEDVRDPLGRGGVAVTFTSEAWHTTLLFDPETGDVRGVRSVGLKELPGRTITDWSVIVESSRRASAPDAPTMEELRDRAPQVLLPAKPPRR